MSKVTFEVGDVVSLKTSNAPEMVIESIGEITGQVHCIWFNEETGFHRNIFQAACLELLPE